MPNCCFLKIALRNRRLTNSLPHAIGMGSLIRPQIVNFLTKKGSEFYLVIFSLLQPLATID